MIVKRDGKYLVLSHDGKRKFGTYDNEEQARKRLAQIHYFKHLNDSVSLSSVLSYLAEELKDIPASADNIHYTTIENLYNILNDGELIGNKYTIKTFKNKRKNAELCTVRSSRAKELDSLADRTALSENADGAIKIHVFTKRVLSSVRGVKKAPIAELPISSKRDIEFTKNDFKKKFGVDCPIVATREDKFQISIWSKKRDSDQEKRYNKIVAALEKLGLDKNEEAVNRAIHLNNSISNHYVDLRKRESEERFVFKDKNGIPIKPELVKIEILNGWEDDLDNSLGEENEVYPQVWRDFYKLLNRYEDCFVKNHEFEFFKDTIKQYAEKNKEDN